MISKRAIFDEHYHFMGNRLLTHALFWISYYIFYSLLWAEDGHYYRSFGLELIVMPLRILASYAVIYYLLPKYLSKNQELRFLLGYLLIVGVAGLLQRLINFFYYEMLFEVDHGELWDLWSFVKAIVLVNTTVMLITALKIFQLWRIQDNEKSGNQFLMIRAEKRNYRIATNDIQYIEALGNYVTYYLFDGRKLISYQTLKEAALHLPPNFERIHKSFIINKNHVRSFSNENVEIGNRMLPLGGSVELQF